MRQKTSKLLIPKLIVISACISALGCRKSDEVRKVHAEDKSVGRQEDSLSGTLDAHTTKVRSREDKTQVSVWSKENPSKSINALIDRKGAAAIEEIFSLLEGKDRDDAIMTALSLLNKIHEKSELLRMLGKLPPGSAKQKWIWSVVRNGQGEFGPDLFESISGLEYVEEKKAATLAFTSSVTIDSRQQFENAAKFLNDNENVGSEFTQGMASKLLMKYAGTLTTQDPRSAAETVKLLTKDQQSYAAQIVAEGFPTSDPRSALSFAKEFATSQSLSKKIYSTSFEKIGSTSPSDAKVLLQEVPSAHKEDAIPGLVSGWINQDAQAASEWAAAQSGSDLQSAGAAVVGYLESKGTPESQIAPWRSIASAAVPNNRH